MTLYLFSFNNYYNRIVKKHNIVANYGEPLATFENVNFIPNDNIVTEVILNYDGSINPDYIVCTNTVRVPGSYRERIVSRWYITGSTRTRSEQYRFELYRDVLADWYDEVVNAPAFIKKGWVSSINDPAIFNNEEMAFNQIKTAEYFIKDKSQSGWYVGYLSKDVTTKTINVPSVNVNSTEIYNTDEEYPYSKYTLSSPFLADYSDVSYQMYAYYPNGVSYLFSWDDAGQPKELITGNYVENQIASSLGDGVTINFNTNQPRGFKISGTANDINTRDVWQAAAAQGAWRPESYVITGAHTDEQTNTFLEQSGKIIKVGDVIKKVVVNKIQNETTGLVDASNAGSFGNKITSVASSCSWISTSTSAIYGNVSSINYSAPAYYITLEPVSESAFSFEIPAERQHTEGCPYDIFAIPAYLQFESSSGSATDPNFSNKVINAIINTLDSSELFDVQLVPYCPLSDEFLDDTYTIGEVLTNKLKNTTTLKQYQLLQTSEPLVKTLIIYASVNEFRKIIKKNPITIPENVIDYKVSNECDIYRLCSPNYNGQFEFSAAKNGGVNGWNVSFTYKPFLPYIKISPQFNRLYGKNFFDARGLVCGGDFSISQTDEAWRQYELQNKNFQVMFDRQIQNMEVNNSINRFKEKVQAAVGTASGAVTTGMGGKMIGGPTGAFAGAMIGGISSGIGGLADIALNDKLRAEAMDYTKDQFGYSLQNIQALPYSLTKIGTQNIDYKIWPFVEYYTCTTKEKSALKDKIKWNGMSIGRIGTVKEFIDTTNTEGTFIQGKVIRLEGLEENSLIANIINTELQTGAYFT